MGTDLGFNSSMVWRLGKDPSKYIKTTDLKALDGMLLPNIILTMRWISQEAKSHLSLHNWFCFLDAILMLLRITKLVLNRRTSKPKPLPDTTKMRRVEPYFIYTIVGTSFWMFLYKLWMEERATSMYSSRSFTYFLFQCDIDARRRPAGHNAVATRLYG